jgi:AraC-like DNA-binding protein
MTTRAKHPADTRESTVSIRVVRGLVDAAELHGVPRAQFLHWAQLCPAQLADAHARITHAEVYRLCELALEVTADPALGLHLGEKLTGLALNPVCDLIAHSATLRDGLDALSRFHPLLSDHTSVQVCEHDQRVTVYCSPFASGSPRIQSMASEMIVAGLFRLIRSFNAYARLERASFEYAAPSYHAEYERVFQRSACFEQRFTGIVFDRALMDSVSPHRDQDMHDALRAIAERHMSRTQGASVALRVREVLLQQQSGPRTDMSSVARALGLSVRSLRRRLAAEGKSYNAVANDALVMVAKRFLVDEQRTIQETAYEMGFSHCGAFHRAFKTWTGTTPRAFLSTRSGWS